MSYSAEPHRSTGTLITAAIYNQAVSDNPAAIYAGAVVKGAAHQGAAKLWLSFVHSPQALSIFKRYGFKPYTGKAPTD